MVNLRYVKSRLFIFILTVISFSFLMGGCKSLTENGDDEKQAGKSGINHEEETVDIPIRGPDAVPDGLRYDEWNGIEYTKDTGFKVRTFWVIPKPSDPGVELIQTPEHIEDAALEIIDAKAEPVGGEMKLRSGGYVDISIELRWTGTMKYTTNDELEAMFSSFGWIENPPLPFDFYTGTSLLNHSDTEDSNSGEISVGEAQETNMTESVITWEGRTYRLFASKDVRNASFGGRNYVERDGKYDVAFPGVVDFTLLFRVPADYDGLAIAVDKDITDEKYNWMNEQGDFLDVSDTYADILTTNFGKKQTAEDYYFIKVSDILEKFGNKDK